MSFGDKVHSSSSYFFQTLRIPPLHFIQLSCTLIGPLLRSLKIPSPAHRIRLSVTRVMQSSGAVSIDSSKRSSNNTNNDIGQGQVQVRSAGASISLPNIPIWAKLVLGSIIFIALPFYKKILRIEAEVEKDAEAVVEFVEKVAVAAEKVAVDVAAALPGDGGLKQAVLKAVIVAAEVTKDVERAEALIHKVDEIKEEIDTVVDPFIVEVGVALISERKPSKEGSSPSTDSSKAT